MRHESGERSFQSEAIPPVHGHLVAEPHMSKLVHIDISVQYGIQCKVDCDLSINRQAGAIYRLSPRQI